MPPLADLPTPCLLLDREKMQRNIDRMYDRLAKGGVPLRPHVKTGKSAEIARALVKGQPGGITVSTLAEADFFLGHGFADILYAVGIAPQRLPAIADLIRRGASMSIILDSVEAARAVADFALPGDMRLGVLIEVDSGGHRAGLKSDDPALVHIAEILRSARSADLRGVLVHAGESYGCPDRECIAAAADRERLSAVSAATFLRGHGYKISVISVGSTPTATFAGSFEGVTEFRAGVFVFEDLVMAGLGICRIEDIALSVLATVIGSRPSESRIIVDSGWTALSRDRGTAKQRTDQYYGLVCDLEGKPFDDLVVLETSQEHGVIARRDGSPVDLGRFPVGSRLRILPNHACATAAQHDSYYVLEAGQATDRWYRCAAR